MRKFPTANLLLAFHELEQRLLNLGRGVIEQQRFILNKEGKCREMGRAAGFFASAGTITELIKKLMR
jgi:hypothetical protein